MKYLITLFFILLTPPTSIHAQEVYNMVLANATRTVNSPSSGYMQTQIAQFKRTALIYMKEKAFEASDNVSAEFLNTQAYYLSEYITVFIDELLKSKRTSEEKRKELILLFMDASVSNPLFDDPDTETTMSFITNGGEITPFCLNTDWQKAYAAIKANI